MSVSCRRRIVDEVVALLAAISVDGLTVVHNPDVPPDDQDLPYLAVIEGQEVADDSFLGEDGYVLSLEIEGTVGGATETAAEVARDELRAAVIAVMRRLPTVSTLPIRGVDAEGEPAAQPLILNPAGPMRVFSLSWSVLYSTAEGDPFTFA